MTGGLNAPLLIKGESLTQMATRYYHFLGHNADTPRKVNSGKNECCGIWDVRLAMYFLIMVLSETSGQTDTAIRFERIVGKSAETVRLRKIPHQEIRWKSLYFTR